MTRGPQQQRLADFVAPADDATLDHLGSRWSQGATLLRQYAAELQLRSEQISEDADFTGDTAKTAKASFAHSATTMTAKANELGKGSGAFHAAAEGVRHARTKSADLAKHDGDAPPSRPDVTPGSNDPEDVRKMRDFNTATTNYWDGYHARETAAATAIAALEHNHTTQAKVFQAIHGEPPPEPPIPPPGRNPVTQGTRPTTTHVPGGLDTTDHNVKPGPTHTVTDTHPGVIHLPTPDETYGLPPHHTSTPGNPGIPQGPGTTQGTPLPAGPGMSGAGGVGGVGTVGGGAGAVGGIGAAAGGALGGAAAAGLAAGGLNGGLNGLLPAGGGVRGSLSAAGVRGIGATSRTGVGSVLGRGTGAAGAGRAGAGGMAGRNGGSRGAGSRGSRGRSGARGAGTGAGRGGGKDKKRQGEERDLFDDGSDWIDDEDAAPGLID